jgi:hypothetical protein
MRRGRVHVLETDVYEMSNDSDDTAMMCIAHDTS